MFFHNQKIKWAKSSFPKTNLPNLTILLELFVFISAGTEVAWQTLFTCCVACCHITPQEEPQPPPNLAAAAHRMSQPLTDPGRSKSTYSHRGWWLQKGLFSLNNNFTVIIQHSQRPSKWVVLKFPTTWRGISDPVAQTSPIKPPTHSVPIDKTRWLLRKWYSEYTNAVRVHCNVMLSNPNPITSFYKVYPAHWPHFKPINYSNSKWTWFLAYIHKLQFNFCTTIYLSNKIVKPNKPYEYAGCVLHYRSTHVKCRPTLLVVKPHMKRTGNWGPSTAEK